MFCSHIAVWNALLCLIFPCIPAAEPGSCTQTCCQTDFTYSLNILAKVTAVQDFFFFFIWETLVCGQKKITHDLRIDCIALF